jgi:hypothetical protein
VIPEWSLSELGWLMHPNMFRAPALALAVWSPLWVGPYQGNAQFYVGIGAIAGEWQNFVSGRLREDFAFLRRVAQSRSPDEIWAAYVEFWQRAVEDYGKEYLTMGRLAAGVTSKSV